MISWYVVISRDCRSLCSACTSPLSWKYSKRFFPYLISPTSPKQDTRWIRNWLLEARNCQPIQRWRLRCLHYVSEKNRNKTCFTSVKFALAHHTTRKQSNIQRAFSSTQSNLDSKSLLFPPFSKEMMLLIYGFHLEIGCEIVVGSDQRFRSHGGLSADVDAGDGS